MEGAYRSEAIAGDGLQSGTNQANQNHNQNQNRIKYGGTYSRLRRSTHVFSQVTISVSQLRNKLTCVAISLQKIEPGCCGIQQPGIVFYVSAYSSGRTSLVIRSFCSGVS